MTTEKDKSSNDKTAEEIEPRLLVKRIWQRAYMDTEESHIQLIRDYSTQQLKGYKDVIRELLPTMDAMKDLCDSVGALYIGKHRVSDLSDLIIRARKLIDQTDTK